MSRVAAFFDIDGTLYREGLITEIFKKMIKYEIIESDKWYKEVRPSFIKWDRREGDYDLYLLKMISIYIEAIKGIDKRHIEYIAQRVIEQKGGRVYTYSRERIKWHKDNNHVLIIISGSPIELVREMALKYGFDDYKGAVYLLDKENKYTGDVIPMWDSKSKKEAIDEMVCRYDIDLSQSYAYGDTSGDFTMLKAVSHPYCINPTKELLDKVSEDEEIRKKIKIVVERKDVTYNLNINDIQYV
ncbi:MAG: HAD-IB family hydrolase [Clostridiaceae bacterium]